MSDTLIYHVLSDDKLTNLLRSAARPDPYLSAESVAERFELKPDMLTKLVKEKRIKKYSIDGHSKIVRYKESELIEILKPII